MKITLSPQFLPEKMTLAVHGDALHITIDGEPLVLDFSQLPEGGVLPASAVECEYIVGDVKRVGGGIELMLLLPIPHGAPRSCTFPEPITTTGDGPVALPTDEVAP